MASSGGTVLKHLPSHFQALSWPAAGYLSYPWPAARNPAWDLCLAGAPSAHPTSLRCTIKTKRRSKIILGSSWGSLEPSLSHLGIHLVADLKCYAEFRFVHLWTAAVRPYELEHMSRQHEVLCVILCTQRTDLRTSFTLLSVAMLMLQGKSAAQTPGPVLGGSRIHVG